jgi:hypothetical protein
MRLAIAIVVALVSSGCPKATTTTTTTTTTTATAPTPTPMPTPTAPPRPPTPHELVGRWTETFASRGGCSDTIEIVRSGYSYAASGADCNDNTPYEFRDFAYDGDAVTLQVNVPETGFVVHYTLHWGPDDELAGTAEVVGPSRTEHFDVRWTRSR